MNLKVIGMEPGSAVSLALDLYDKKADNEKVHLLISSKLIDMVDVANLPKDFASGRLVDINAGELLSLGVVGTYYNLLDQAKNKTYQVVVGVDDASKTLTENVLSDGAIWDNQNKGKMPFQQVLVQGFYPERKITEESVIDAINNKISKRTQYPNNCGLIVSVYGEKGQINFQKILESCDLDKFQVVFAVTYQLPGLKTAMVARLDKSLAPDVFIQNAKNFKLDRFTSKSDWQIRKG